MDVSHPVTSVVAGNRTFVLSYLICQQIILVLALREHLRIFVVQHFSHQSKKRWKFFKTFYLLQNANKEIGAMKCASFLRIIMLYFVSLLHSNIQLNYNRFENAIDILWIITLVYICTYQAECFKLWKLDFFCQVYT